VTLLADRDPEKRCTAKSQRNGRRCGAYAIRGGNVCSIHGGRAPQVRDAAKARFEELVPVAIKELQKILDDEYVEPEVKLKAVAEVLDRTYFPKTSRRELEVEKIERYDPEKDEYRIALPFGKLARP
jgi:hypothetical protein